MKNHAIDIVIGVIPFLLYIPPSHFEAKYNALDLYEKKCIDTKGRRKKRRIKWSSVCKRISDKQFRRMFCMTRECFVQLCSKIITSVGEKEFKSESYIDAFLLGKDSMYMAHEKTSGGYISGETKLGITLRILAGGDVSDLGVIFDISPKHCNEIMLRVILLWGNKSKIGSINIYDYLADDRAMETTSEGFSKRSDGILKGAIGALDGWLVRIQRPSLWRDGVLNVTSFFSRKGFYALNVQVIVDDKKRVLWVSYSHKGGSHDSSSFRATRLYDHLKTISSKLLEKVISYLVILHIALNRFSYHLMTMHNLGHRMMTLTSTILVLE